MAAAKANILSVISNKYCDAYLLSESSLIVYDDAFIMFTCGTTTLVDAIFEFLNHYPIQQIQSLVYERKNALFPHAQTTSFMDDIATLKTLMDGHAYQFGNNDDHHLFLFHLDHPFAPKYNDMTLEILMHGMNHEALNLFTSSPKNIHEIRKMTDISEIFSDFTLDDHLFEPVGYSVNAIKDRYYYAIHITPQPVGSYASLETNYIDNIMLKDLIEILLTRFTPDSYDIVLFKESNFTGIPDNGYVLTNDVYQHLTSGYHVRYQSYKR